jgi:hypothetical protein
MPVFFNGRLLITPTVASRVDDSAMANRNLSVPMNLAIIGRADSGEPFKAIKLGTPVEAREIFKGGELLKAIEKAFAPSSQTMAPQTIFAFRVDPATQARYVVAQSGVAETAPLQALGEEDDPTQEVKLAADCAGAEDGAYNGYRILMTSGNAFGETNLIEGFTDATKIASLRYKWKNGPAAGDTYELIPASFCLESSDYGLNANRIKTKIQSGTVVGTKYAYTKFGSDEYYKDNLGATYFTLKYTGAEASGLVEVTAGAINVSAGDPGSEALLYTCDLTVYDTVGKAVDFFDSKPDIDAVATAEYRDYGVATKLDYVEDVSISGQTPTEITANLQAIIDWFNSLSEPFVTAYRPSESGAVPPNFDWVYLGGATVTTPITANWQTCFDLLQSEDVQCVIPLSSNASIHAMADTHCQFMSNNGAMERRTIVGGALNESQEEVIERAMDLNSDRCYLVSPGFKDYSDNGVLTTYPPYILAALLGGMICGSDPGTSLTNKTVSVRGLELKYRVPTDTDSLLQAGVIPVVVTRQGYKIAQSVSTWLANDNYNRVEMGTGFAVDFVARNIRNNLQDLVGRKGTPAVLAEAVSRVESQLKELARPAPLGPEVITGDEENPAYKNITATLEGDVLRVFFVCSPVVPVNYIPVGISVVPYSGSARS